MWGVPSPQERGGGVKIAGNFGKTRSRTKWFAVDRLREKLADFNEKKFQEFVPELPQISRQKCLNCLAI